METKKNNTENGDGELIPLPILKYGYRTQPMEWDEIVTIITVERDLAKLTRSEMQQRHYEESKRQILEEWSSMTDYVMCTKFDTVFTKHIDPGAKRFIAYPLLQEIAHSGSRYMRLIQNDFPYAMADGIEHWILWKVGSGGCITKLEIQQAKAQLVQYRMDKNYILHWVNDVHLKSVPEIDHVHIIGKVSDANGRVDTYLR